MSRRWRDFGTDARSERYTTEPPKGRSYGKKISKSEQWQMSPENPNNRHKKVRPQKSPGENPAPGP